LDKLLVQGQRIVHPQKWLSQHLRWHHSHATTIVLLLRLLWLRLLRRQRQRVLWMKGRRRAPSPLMKKRRG